MAWLRWHPPGIEVVATPCHPALTCGLADRRGKVKEQGVDPEDREEVLRRTREAAILVFTKPKTSLRTAAIRLNDSMNVDGSTLIRLASEAVKPAQRVTRPHRLCR